MVTAPRNYHSFLVQGLPSSYPAQGLVLGFNRPHWTFFFHILIWLILELMKIVLFTTGYGKELHRTCRHVVGTPPACLVCDIVGISSTTSPPDCKEFLHLYTYLVLCQHYHLPSIVLFPSLCFTHFDLLMGRFHLVKQCYFRL